MTEQSGPFAVRGRLLVGGAFMRGALVAEGGTIRQLIPDAELDAAGLPARVLDAAIVSPGLIDLQTNGGFGFEVGADAAQLRALAARLPATGVTAFLPTLVSDTSAHYRSAFEAFTVACAAGAAARDAAGARPLGLHLEGPFISAERAGAHRRDAILSADPTIFDEALGRGLLRLVTLAPERPGALALIARLREQGVVVSLGHTDASAEDFRRGVDAGASMATHLYNAMSPFKPRAPGAMGAALTDERITAGLIADGVHCHPAALLLALRAKGPDRLALVTDATAAAGLGPGVYTLGGQTIISDGRAVCLPDATLAGSALTLDQAIRNFIGFTGASPAAALHMATEVPARLLGLTAQGRLAVGCDADLVLWSDQLRVETTFIGGRPYPP